jgi:low temperature requirement protein LtrA
MEGSPSMSRTFNYAGIGGAVAGVVSLLGIYSYWWSTETTSYDGIADISGRLALGMSIGMFAFGVAYVLISDRAIRRAVGALMTICAVVLTLACVWAVFRSDDVASGATVELGLWVSAIGGVLGIVASLLALRDAMVADAESSPPGATP